MSSLKLYEIAPAFKMIADLEELGEAELQELDSLNLALTEKVGNDWCNKPPNQPCPNEEESTPADLIRYCEKCGEIVPGWMPYCPKCRCPVDT